MWRLTSYVGSKKMIPFSKPYLTGHELTYIKEVHSRGLLAGDGHFTKQCHAWMEGLMGCHKALLTHSCTAALEMAAILADIQPGDEVIMPSYTFVSTANAFVLRGGIPVFVDIREDTLNINEKLIEGAITSKTKAIVPVHYAGVACEMDVIMEIARQHNLLVIEDAAQAIMSTYKGQKLGSIGDLGCLSFHETKNLISGEGGALLVNNVSLLERAEIIREKGTNRSQFFRGQIDKYTWVDVGSSYLPGELIAAFLYAQLQDAGFITSRRLELWNHYHEVLAPICSQFNCCRPPNKSHGLPHNAHMYYLIFDDLGGRKLFMDEMRSRGVHCVFHYVPLHSSHFGSQNSKAMGSLEVTQKISETIVRLPLFIGVDQDVVLDSAKESIEIVAKSKRR